MTSGRTDYSLQATYYRTTLLLGLSRGEAVHEWAERMIAQDPEPPHAFLEAVSVPPSDLTALRHALWPLVVEPDPREVIEAILAVLHVDLVSGRRGLGDTVTIMRQMPSMLRLPRDLYDSLNGALVAHMPDRVDGAAIAGWLGQFAHDGGRPRTEWVPGRARCGSADEPIRSPGRLGYSQKIPA